MVRQVVNIEIVLTDNESESLTLESNLIKTQQPYFNILLKDDKKYPYICITWSEDYPRIYITRRRRNRKSRDKYYGPFVDVQLLRQTLFSVKKLFPLRQRPTPLYRDRTCLNYSIKRCPGVCQEKISSTDYYHILKRVEMIFQGRNEELKSLLIQHMNKLSSQEKYEQAILIRDQINGIDKLNQSQKMIIPDSSVCRDIIAMASKDQTTAIQIFQMRAGKLVGRLGYASTNNDSNHNIILQQIIEEHYSNVDPVEIPSEILIQKDLPARKHLTDWLSEIRNQKVQINVPIRSKKAEIIRLVEKNALYELNSIIQGKDKEIRELDDLTELLELSHIPKRIECYDISHIQGSDAVGSQVVFINGSPAKQHYRKYIIKNKDVFIGHSDDYQSLSEVIRRRFKRWSKLKVESDDFKQLVSRQATVFESKILHDWPDLVVIDGGKGQLNAVMKTLKDLNLDNEINVISIAKKNEEIYIPGLSDPVESSKEQSAILLLRRLRDEAHRFAITFHRKRRSNRMKRSQLTEIPNVGPKRINALLSYFKSIDAIQLATKEELSTVEGVGKSSAEIIWKYFNP